MSECAATQAQSTDMREPTASTVCYRIKRFASLRHSVAVVTDGSRNFPRVVFVLPRKNELPFAEGPCVVMLWVMEAVNTHLNRAIALHVIDMHRPWNEFSGRTELWRTSWQRGQRGLTAKYNANGRCPWDRGGV